MESRRPIHEDFLDFRVRFQRIIKSRFLSHLFKLRLFGFHV